MDSGGFYTTRGGIAWPSFWLPNLITAYAISFPPYFQWTETEIFVTLSSSLNSCNICGFSVESKHVFYTPYYWCRWTLQNGLWWWSEDNLEVILRPYSWKFSRENVRFVFRDHTTAHIWDHPKSVPFPVHDCVTQFHFCQEVLLNSRLSSCSLS